MAAQRPVIHLPIGAALCTGLYAASLALVAGQQSQHDGLLTSQRTPMVDAVARAAAERLAAEEAVLRASLMLQRASGGYAGAAALSADMDRLLAILAGQVADASGAAARLPTSLPLPAAPAGVSRVAPATVATTTASGK
jgi:hypothetical protein